MSFTFDPEAANSSWPEGQYEAEIADTNESISKKSGDPMLVVKYLVHHPQGQTQHLTDYFTAPEAGSGRKGNLFRLRSLCMAIGGDVYEAFRKGDLNHQKQLRGQLVLLTLKRETTAEYGDQNKIDTYTQLERRAVGVGAGEDDDDESIPF